MYGTDKWHKLSQSTRATLPSNLKKISDKKKTDPRFSKMNIMAATTTADTHSERVETINTVGKSPHYISSLHGGAAE